MKFEQQPALWCQGLLGVRTGIIEQRVADRASWHWEQTDVAIIKKYTTSELNMKSGGVARIEHTSRLSVTCPIAATCCKFRNHRLVGGHHHEKQVNRLNYAGFKTSRTGCDQKTLEEKKHLARRQLFRTYCRFIIHKQRVSGHSMLCQSVLKHLRHSGSVMKSVKKRRIWQNVLRTLFYHKCFVSQPFYRVFHSQGITSVSEYLMAEAMETLLRLLIVVILQFASCAPRFFTRN